MRGIDVHAAAKLCSEQISNKQYSKNSIEDVSRYLSDYDEDESYIGQEDLLSYFEHLIQYRCHHKTEDKFTRKTELRLVEGITRCSPLEIRY